MSSETIAVFRSCDESAEEIDFDFWSTDPPVYSISVERHDGSQGIRAVAYFRGGHKPRLRYLTTWAYTAEEALHVLCEELEKRFGKEVEDEHQR